MYKVAHIPVGTFYYFKLLWETIWKNLFHLTTKWVCYVCFVVNVLVFEYTCYFEQQNTYVIEMKVGYLFPIYFCVTLYSQLNPLYVSRKNM